MIVEVETSPALVLEFETDETRVIELGPIVWSQDGNSAGHYKAALSGFSAAITSSEHQLSLITSIAAFDSAGREVSVAAQIQSDNSVTIESNIDLNGINLLLSGV